MIPTEDLFKLDFPKCEWVLSSETCSGFIKKGKFSVCYGAEIYLGGKIGDKIESEGLVTFV